MDAWIRKLEVTLTSKLNKQKFVFGKEDNLSISVTGKKYMSALQDECKIEIKNLTYYQIAQIIQGEYYEVDVRCGYTNIPPTSIFKGGVIWISNSYGDVESGKTNIVTILCASELVARYQQKRINLSLNSGINMYSALNYISKQAGIATPNISDEFRKKFLDDAISQSGSTGNILQGLANANETYIVNSDATLGSTFSIFDAARSNSRVITLNNTNINFSGGYPTLTDQGLRLSIMPTFAFMCGDTIKIDNSLIDISVTSTNEISKNYAYYLDVNGCYMIYEIDFSLENRGSDYTLNMLCKSRNSIAKLLGTNV